MNTRKLLPDKLKFLALCLALTALPAQAYTDPGTGALIWQMLVAGFIGAMFYLRRFTSWFRRKKDENVD